MRYHLRSLSFSVCMQNVRNIYLIGNIFHLIYRIDKRNKTNIERLGIGVFSRPTGLHAIPITPPKSENIHISLKLVRTLLNYRVLGTNTTAIFFQIIFLSMYLYISDGRHA